MPVMGMLFALVFVRMIAPLDAMFGWKSAFGVEGSLALFSAMGSAMLTFIVFVFSMLLVAVQLASAQLSPRIIATAFRDRVTKFALTIFVFTFCITLACVHRTQATIPYTLEWLATYCNVVSIAVYLYLIDHVGRMLRAANLLQRVAAEARTVIEAIYPHRLATAEEAQVACAAPPLSAPEHVVECARDGVFLAFDQAGLLELARGNDCLIELVPQVGDFVAKGSPLFRLHGGAGIDPRKLRQAVAFGSERTMEQDPLFAFRIIVDIASKALSPAINDPTTAVLALDQLQHLLRSVGGRRLDTGRVRDAEGRLRFTFHTPDWDDFIGLSLTEIRHYGRDSIQIARRMRAMLEDLMQAVPEPRRVRLRQELALLNRSVQRNFVEPEDRASADISDSQGMGGGARGSAGAIHG